ncbi:ornithine--oxo-acid transaminase [Cumulibacter manganitolerans]|uniref:ornithine--oxo-acid transaminase n=1 Tax=Cumulibacter manganitolerans TaxID=1884992 RepID=UPI001297A9BE|nr:ornithine--oxo-acid transaminase [Cumulibacter manganitolerans]
MSERSPFVATNYHPLPVTLARGEGSWVWDVDGRRYLDLLAGYSALNFGHRHPALIQAAKDQLDRLTLTSRAFNSANLAEFCRRLARFCGKEVVLPMNTGAEAVETGIKLARKWGYRVKGVPDGRAEIIVMKGNFHGRTSTIVSFSDDPDARDGYGPYMPGFVSVPYGDVQAVRAAITPHTVAVLFEPIQGEGGVLIPPDGFLRDLRGVCTEHDVLMIADEIQSGLGRTGLPFACDHEDVVPDVYLLGKALGGGIMPVSAVVSDASAMQVFTPGTHGSTFGGNPLAAAIGIAVLDLLEDGEMLENTKRLEPVLREGLEALPADKVTGVRVRGLWAGVDLADRTGRAYSEGLMARGVLCKDTHGRTVRFAPPLTIAEEDLRWALGELAAELG